LEVLPAALDGCLEALIPLSVVFGAIALFKTMEYTKVRMLQRTVAAAAATKQHELYGIPR
jgi:L-lactate permease